MNSPQPDLVKVYASIIIMLFISMSAALAQSARPASFDKQTKVVSLDESIPFGYQYEIDVTDLELDGTEALKNYFDKFETELVSYRVRSDTLVEIQLNLRKRPDWTAADWNTYLKKIDHE